LKLEPEAHVALYRIAQEAISNVAQHAEAETLRVRLHAGPPVELVVEDDGTGFDYDRLPAGHFGLRNMRDRAGAIGADFSMYSEPERGTTVRVVWQP
jgi:signal transduction histidine kinase